MKTSTPIKTIFQKLFPRVIAFALIALSTPFLDAQELQCVNFPATTVDTDWVDGEAYAQIVALTFNPVPANYSDPLFFMDVDFNVTLVNNETGTEEVYGPFTGPSADMFHTQYGPLDGDGTSYTLVLEPIGFDGDCHNSNIHFDSPTFTGAISNVEIGGSINPVEVVAGNKNLISAVSFFEAKNQTAALNILRGTRTFTAGDHEVLETIVALRQDVERANKENISFEVYPNPATDYIVVDASKTDNLERVLVYDLNGNPMVDTYAAGGNEINIDLFNLQLGNYLISFMDDNNNIIDQQQIIKR